MNHFIAAFAWCMAQVTLFTAIAACSYILAQRRCARQPGSTPGRQPCNRRRIDDASAFSISTLENGNDAARHTRPQRGNFSGRTHCGQFTSQAFGSFNSY